MGFNHNQAIAKLSIVAVSICLSFPAHAIRSNVSKKLDRLADNLIKSYLGKRPQTQKQPLAIFSFNTTARLARERVGFAVSELLSHRFVTDPNFVVVERTALNKIFEEQRLQLTGVIDQATAVEIGKLVGTRILLMGNIQKVGQQYQVNARIVDVETGEVVASGYEEFEAGEFEEDARLYLALGPGRQAIGFYFLYNLRHNRRYGGGTGNTGWGGTATVFPRSHTLHMLGGGIRYSPWQLFMVDISVLTSIEKPKYANADVSDLGGSHSRTERIDSGQVIRANLNYVKPLNSKLRWQVGLGAAAYLLHGGGQNILKTVAPGLRAGLEYKPQARLGLGIIVNYDFVTKKGTAYGVEALRLCPFSIEPTIALYF